MKPNAQTEGPLALTPTGHLHNPVSKLLVCYVSEPNRADLLDMKQANRRLLCASFNAFDKAGRALMLDAATLAESVDVAALIRFRATIAANVAALGDSPLSFMSNVRQALQDTAGAAPEWPPRA